MRYFFPLLLITFFSVSCTTASKSTSTTEKVSDQKSTVDESEVPANTDLTSYLRQLSGIEVFGSGASARFQIRGNNGTKGSGSSPLFVVDGRPSGHDYRRIYNTISMANVKKVRVLKGASQTASYGSEGLGGVIYIQLKKQ